jgi:hypothetical protein
VMAECKDRSIWIGKASGGVIGLAGGVVGIYFNIQNTDRPRKRSLIIKSAYARKSN